MRPTKRDAFEITVAVQDSRETSTH